MAVMVSVLLVEFRIVADGEAVRMMSLAVTVVVVDPFPLALFNGVPPPPPPHPVNTDTNSATQAHNIHRGFLSIILPPGRLPPGSIL
jgi:hypothetical protein